MNYEPYNPFKEFEKQRESQIKNIRKQMEESYEKLESPQYKDSLLKEMADDIISSQHEIEEKLNALATDSTEAEKNHVVSLFAL